MWADLKLKTSLASPRPFLWNYAAHVTHSPVNTYQEESTPRAAPHEDNPRAPEKSLEDPRITRKGDPNPKISLPPLKKYLQATKIFQGQPLHPPSHALQIFTDASREGWCAHIGDLMAKGTWSLPESKLHINYLELKVVFLTLKEFQDICSKKIVLIATDNTIVVAYINKEGGIKSAPLCVFLWRILTWCTRKQGTLKA